MLHHNHRRCWSLAGRTARYSQPYSTWYAHSIIDKAREHGYKLVTVGLCSDDAEENQDRDPVSGNALPSLPPRDRMEDVRAVVSVCNL
jgi:hypothetical protein